MLSAGEALLHSIADPQSAERPFNLLRWFSLLSFVAIIAVIGGVTIFMTKHLTTNLLLRDAIVSRDFLEGVLAVDVGEDFFKQPSENRDMDRLDTFVKHMSSLTGLVAATIYGSDSVAVWSSEPEVKNSRFTDGDQLQRALHGYVVVQWGDEVAGDQRRLRANGVNVDLNRLVGMYLPIRGARADDIFAVVKLSATPYALFDSIADDVWLIQSSAVVGGIILFTAFFWIIYRADRTLKAQQERLSEREAMATIGEMSATVAHSIRNPLAAIRSAAELAREDALGEVRESLDDIIHESDRLNGWVSELLMASRANVKFSDRVDLNEVIRASLESRACEAALRNIRVTFDSMPLPLIDGSRALLSHAILNVIANALEAMTEGGTLRIVSRSTDGKTIAVTIEDSGPGIPEDLIQRVMQPMFTTKPNGTGLGLPLTKRIVERHSGRIVVRNRAPQGARVEFYLPVGG